MDINKIEILENKLKKKYSWYKIVPFKIESNIIQGQFNILILTQPQWAKIKWLPIGTLFIKDDDDIEVLLYDEQDLAIKYDLLLNSDEIYNYYKAQA